MIDYAPCGFQLRFIWRVRGSVLPRAFCFALCSAVTAALLKLPQLNEIDYVRQVGIGDTLVEDMHLFGPKLTMFMSFSSIVGFLLVFRTSQAMTRFSSGLSSIFSMNAQWAEACGSLVAFSNASANDPEEIRNFQSLLVQLFSMLNAAAMQNIAGENMAPFNVIHVGQIDDESLAFLEYIDVPDRRHKRTDVIHAWLQELMVKQMSRGVLGHIPPPILTRVFQQLAEGNRELQEAMTITSVPFPFPYSQLTTVLLLVHAIATPYFTSKMTPHWPAAFMVSFVMVSTLSAINFIAAELQQPFEDDPNDLPMVEIQDRMNESLVLRLDKRLHRLPVFEHLPDLGYANNAFEPLKSRRMGSVVVGAMARMQTKVLLPDKSQDTRMCSITSNLSAVTKTGSMKKGSVGRSSNGSVMSHISPATGSLLIAEPFQEGEHSSPDPLSDGEHSSANRLKHREDRQETSGVPRDQPEESELVWLEIEDRSPGGRSHGPSPFDDSSGFGSEVGSTEAPLATNYGRRSLPRCGTWHCSNIYDPCSESLPIDSRGHRRNSAQKWPLDDLRFGCADPGGKRRHVPSPFDDSPGLCSEVGSTEAPLAAKHGGHSLPPRGTLSCSNIYDRHSQSLPANSSSQQHSVQRLPVADSCFGSADCDARPPDDGTVSDGALSFADVLDSSGSARDSHGRRGLTTSETSCLDLPGLDVT